MSLGKGLGSLIPTKKQTTAPATLNSISKEDAANKIWHIPVSLVFAGSSQPRRSFKEESIEELAQSIKEKGILQPLLVTERPDGKYEILAGERRLRAAQKIGLSTIPAIVKELPEQDKIEVALIENIQREDLNVLDEAFAYKRLAQEFSLTHEEISKRVGKSRSEISNKMRLLDLPDVIQKSILDGELSMGKARALLGLKDEKEILEAFYSMVGKKASVRAVEELIASKKVNQGGTIKRPGFVMEAEARLRSSLKTKVNITGRGDKGKIIIEYYSEEEFEKLIGDLS